MINVTCIYGTRGSVNHAAYAAAKGGLMQFSQALALEWAKRGVTVNTLGLGWFEDQPHLGRTADKRTSKASYSRPTSGLSSDVESSSDLSYHQMHRAIIQGKAYGLTEGFCADKGSQGDYAGVVGH